MREYAIILAADLPTSSEVIDVSREVGTIVDGIKVGVATLIESGTGLIRRIREAIDDKPILVDLKIADIGFSSKGTWSGTNAKILKALESSGASHVTVHGFPGPASVAEAVAVARDMGIGVLLLPLMSHAGGGLFFSRPVDASHLLAAAEQAGLELKVSQYPPCRDATDAILILGEALGVEGYIGPATRPDDLTRYRQLTARPVWCPGFGRQDRLGRSLEEQFRDWARVVGPSSAAIVGSAIFGAADRVRAAEEIVAIRDRVSSARGLSPNSP